MQKVSALPHEVRGLIHDQLQLVAVELRLAARSLMTMIFAAVCTGIVLVLVWVGLMVAIGLSLVEVGLHPVFAVLAVTALSSILAGVLFVLIRRRSRDLGLPATMRTLKPSTQNQERAVPGTGST